MKVALTIPTGRPRVVRVVKSFVENWEFYGRDPKDLSIFLSIDTEFKDSSMEDFHLDPDIEKKVSYVEYIGEEERKNLAIEIMHGCNITKNVVNSLFCGRGYSKQRNSALIRAIQEGNDVAICIDDDESPYVPVMCEDGSVKWKNLDFFGPHLWALQSGSDITRGPYLGYQSPIPSDFEKDIPEEIRKKLGEALSFGSEVISKDSFFDLMTKIKYLDSKKLKTLCRAPSIVEYGPYGKQILAGNMGINLRSFVKKKLPLFYTPPEARGEDAIFALQLSKAIVGEVDSFIFHDPFNMYPEVFDGKFPKILAPIPVEDKTSDRFTDALIGWLKYAPILVAMISDDSNYRKDKLKNMLDRIEDPTNQLADLLNQPRLRDCHTILKNYVDGVEKHYTALIYLQNEWRKKVLPSLMASGE